MYNTCSAEVNNKSGEHSHVQITSVTKVLCSHSRSRSCNLSRSVRTCFGFEFVISTGRNPGTVGVLSEMVGEKLQLHSYHQGGIREQPLYFHSVVSYCFRFFIRIYEWLGKQTKNNLQVLIGHFLYFRLGIQFIISQLPFGNWKNKVKTVLISQLPV